MMNMIMFMKGCKRKLKNTYKNSNAHGDGLENASGQTLQREHGQHYSRQRHLTKRYSSL